MLICLLCGCPELNKLSGKSYAKIAHGMFWEAFEGSIERITKLGEFVELIMIPCVIPEVGAGSLNYLIMGG